jgi:hypothetical protein
MSNAKNKKRITGEVAVNWVDGFISPETEMLSKGFERLISTSNTHGYELESWQLSRVSHDAQIEGRRVHVINETIVAVFIAMDSAP